MVLYYQNINLRYFTVQTEIDDDSSSSEDDPAEQVDISKPHNSYLQVLFLFIIIWQFSFNISNTAISSLLKFLKYFFCCLGKAYKSLNGFDKEILSHLV